MTEGWTWFGYALAAWFVTGFLTLMIAIVFQLPRIDKQIVDAARKVSSGEQGVLKAFNRRNFGPEIDSSNSGILAGIGFTMVTSSIGMSSLRQHLEFGYGRSLFIAFIFIIFAAFPFVRLCRAVVARLRGGAK